MGHAQRQLEANYSTPEGFVCPGCVTDDHLARALANALEDEACSYCGSQQAAGISVLLECLEETISHYYVDPAEELLYDGREGGYQGAVSDGQEIVENLDDWTECDKLREDAAQAFAASEWCKRGYYGLDRYEGLKFGWDGFVEQVKHRTRYLFLQEFGRGDEHHPNYISPGNMLDAIGALFRDHNLFRSIPSGTELVRARVVEVGERPSTAEELGTVCREKAKLPNRMSPAGIPVFYAGLDEETAVLETYEPSRTEPCEIALAHFRNERALCVLDLTRMPELPSQFDPENRDKRMPLVFLHSFERDLTRPVARDDGAHTEYVPTQVVTEYVRHRLTTPDGMRVDGILYRSSRDRNRIAVVLFAEDKHCGPRPREPLVPEPLLTLVGVRYAGPSEFAQLWTV